VGAWLVWMHAYYGAVLPNSYYAREAPLSVRTVREGAFYLFEFLLSYGLVPFALLAIVSLKGLLAKPGTRIFVIVIAAWCLYVVRESGDFMEFRFLVPVLPFAFIVVTALLIGMLERRVRAVLVITVLLCSLFHAVSYHGSHGIDPVRKMRDYVSGPNGNWREVGRALRDLFPPGGGRVVIAAAAAGTIPYYSELPTVDMFGINDRWIARHGYIVGAHAGHRKGATLQYLVDRGVNLVIGHPLIEDVDVATPAAPYSIEDLRSLLIQDVKGAELPPTARMIDIPIDPGHTVAVLYLVRSEEVDRVVREKRLNVHDIIR
jgi:arabinofuranosyltransferase